MRLPACARCTSPLTLDVRYAMTINRRVPTYRATRGAPDPVPQRLVLCPPCHTELQTWLCSSR